MTLKLAGLRRRFTCLAYECLVIFSILIIGFLIPQIVLSGFGWQTSPRSLWLHLFLLLLAYFGWCWVKAGQTLPMKTWKLQVTNPDGTPVRPLQAVLRYFLAWCSALLGGLGFWWAFFDQEKQFLHDRLAGTRIVDCR